MGIELTSEAHVHQLAVRHIREPCDVGGSGIECERQVSRGLQQARIVGIGAICQLVEHAAQAAATDPRLGERREQFIDVRIALHRSQQRAVPARDVAAQPRRGGCECRSQVLRGRHRRELVEHEPRVGEQRTVHVAAEVFAVRERIEERSGLLDADPAQRRFECTEQARRLTSGHDLTEHDGPVGSRAEEPAQQSCRHRVRRAPALLQHEIWGHARESAIGREIMQQERRPEPAEILGDAARVLAHPVGPGVDVAALGEPRQVEVPDEATGPSLLGVAAQRLVLAQHERAERIRDGKISGNAARVIAVAEQVRQERTLAASVGAEPIEQRGRGEGACEQHVVPVERVMSL